MYLYVHTIYLSLQLTVWRTLEKDPIFTRPAIQPTTEEMKRRAAVQLNKFWQYNFMPQNALNLSYKEKVTI